MRICVSLSALQRALAFASRISATRTTEPILTHVLLRAHRGRFEILATDRELALRTDLGPTGEKWATTVHAGQLAKFILSHPPGAPAELQCTTGERTVISVHGARVTFRSYPPAEFPTGLFDPDPNDRAVDVPRWVFAAAAAAARIADTRESSSLACVQIRLEPSRLIVAAAHPHRMQRLEIPVDPDDGTPTGEVLISRRGALELVHILDEPGDGRLTIGGGRCWTTLGHSTLAIRTFAGTFPDLSPLIPGPPIASATLFPGSLIDATRRMMELLGDHGEIRLAIGDGLGISGGPTDSIEEVAETVAAVTAGNEQGCTVQARYLYDLVAGAEPGMAVTIGVRGAEAPLSCTSPAMPGWLAVTMPIRPEIGRAADSR